MTFSTYSKQKKPRIAETVKIFLANKKKQLADPFLLEAVEKLERFSIKGKMLRGVFVLLAHDMCKGKKEKEAYTAAVAIELLHAGLLIHDDIFDNDTLRRGEKTIFAQYGRNLYGQSMGICIGDFAFFLAMELLSDPVVLKVFAKEAQSVCLAQAKDVSFGHSSNEPSEEEIRTVYRLKTARYSFSLPFAMGAILTGADKKTVNLLDTFGEKLGIAFQMQDDELGIFGEDHIIGKPVGSDIRENKKTLIRFFLFQKANANDKKILTMIFGKKDLTGKDLQMIKQHIKNYGILEKLAQEKKILIDEALSLLNNITVDKKYKEILAELAIA